MNDQSPDAAFVSEHWVAARLGCTYERFRKNRDVLESEGLPPRDSVLRMRIKADVDAWIENRRWLNDPENITPSQEKTT